MASILTQNKFGGASKHQLPTGSFAEQFVIDEEGSLPCAIITTYKIITEENIQFTPTIGTDLYVYVLGTTPYTLVIGGQLFNDCCETSNENGSCVKDILAKYEQLKASKNNKPISVRIGEVAFNVLLQDISITASSEAKTEIFEFTMTLKGIKVE